MTGHARTCSTRGGAIRRRSGLVVSLASLLVAVALVAAGCGSSGSSTTTVTETVAAAEAATTAGTTATAESAAATSVTSAIVIELQQVMAGLGYYAGPIDGVYGPATTEAVTAMQTALGVTADGIYGPDTHAALQGKGDSIVASLQTTLTTYGYYTGPVDGQYGPATEAAVTTLQTDLGVPADGQFGPETAQALDEAVANGTLQRAST